MSAVSMRGALYSGLCLFAMTLQIIAQSEYCLRNTTNQTELREPIILSNSTGRLDFYIPNLQDGMLTFDQKQRFIVSCPNPKNVLTLSNSNVTAGQCQHGKLHVAGKLHSFQELSCNKSIRGDVCRRADGQPTSSCGIKGNKQGSHIDIGYLVSHNGRNEFLTLIEVCHDLNMGNTYYTSHLLRGKLINQSSKSRFRPGFSTQGLSTSAAIAYKQSYQKATFTKLLGSARLAESYINSKSFLSRGHLAPDADFLFAPWQFSTYFYLNVVPQWQTVNGGNWHKVESMVRKLAGQLGSDLQIITGSHGVLTLPGVDHTAVDIYMLPKKILPVPKYVWKLVYSPSDRKEAIVLVVLNNPFVKDASQVEMLCTDVCHRYAWWDQNWSRLDKGVVFCCDYKDFQGVVRSVPDIDVRGVLQGPKKVQ